jgi:hypothetical protein
LYVAVIHGKLAVEIRQVRRADTVYDLRTSVLFSQPESQSQLIAIQIIIVSSTEKSREIRAP